MITYNFSFDPNQTLVFSQKKQKVNGKMQEIQTLSLISVNSEICINMQSEIITSDKLRELADLLDKVNNSTNSTKNKTTKKKSKTQPLALDCHTWEDINKNEKFDDFVIFQ